MSITIDSSYGVVILAGVAMVVVLLGLAYLWRD